MSLLDCVHLATNEIYRMDYACELDPKVRVANKFYNRIRSHLNDLELVEPERQRPSHDKLRHFKEEDKYGVIKPKELESLLSAYELKPHETIKCDKLEANSLAKLLFSKSGFHEPASTEYLIEDLSINDRHRNSFLGGHSTYNTRNENKLAHIRDCQQKMYIKEKARELVNKIDHQLMTQNRLDANIENEIKELVRIDRDNGNVLLVKGKHSLVRKDFRRASEYLRDALKNECALEELAKNFLSESLNEEGIIHFTSNQHERATECFTEALSLNSDNESAKLHLEMSQRKMLQDRRPIGFRGLTQSHQRRR